MNKTKTPPDTKIFVTQISELVKTEKWAELEVLIKTRDQSNYKDGFDDGYDDCMRAEQGY